jgi:5-methylcytosine-specific restriction endonuclease McrA
MLDRCSMPDCERVVYGHGLCQMHWHRWYRHGDAGDIVRTCAWCGVGFTVARNRHSARACSVTCSNRLQYAARKAALAGAKCTMCGIAFAPSSKDIRFCKRCAGIVAASARARDVTCNACGRIFKTSNPHEPVCSECSYRARIKRTVARNHRRKALDRGAFGPTYTERDWRHLIARYRGMCAYCGVRPAEHRDHVTPVSRGGGNSIGNILPACAQCNLSKGSLFLTEWKYKTRCHLAKRQAPAALHN